MSGLLHGARRHALEPSGDPIRELYEQAVDKHLADIRGKLEAEYERAIDEGQDPAEVLNRIIGRQL